MALSSLWIGRQVWAFRAYQMDLDEAVHANRGLDIASALQRGSLADLWAETIQPDWYPPAFGYLLGAWFLLVDPSTASARWFAVFCYFLLGLVLWLSAREAFPQANPFLYLLPPLLLISDDQHVVHSALTMLELPATLLAMTALYFFVKSLRKPATANFFFTSLFAVLCLMTRYNHGIFLLAGLAICYLLFLKSSLRGKFRMIVLAWLPALAFLLLWLFGLGHWQWLVSYADVQSQGVNQPATLGYLFYPRQLLSESSGWLPLLLLAAAIPLWIRRRQFPPAAIPYLVFIGISFLFLATRTHNVLRFGMLLFPPLWVLAAGAAGELTALIKSQRLRAATIIAGLILLVFFGVKNNYTLPLRLSTAYENTNTGVNQAYQFIADSLDQPEGDLQKLVMVGENDNWSAYALHFYLQSRCMAAHPKCRVLVSGERELRKGWPPRSQPAEQADQRTAQALSEADHIVIFAKQPQIPPGWQPLASSEFELARYQIAPVKMQVLVLEHE
jgi:hypothetical protein